ncbi:MAG: glycosyltransferase family 39 protein [Salinivirgaceae bacterium]|nr:glycosyltransferase family 39 protein [Salinivirgaceae bacterium]
MNLRKALIIIVGINLVRLAFLPFMGMMPQDAYYYFYSEHLSLSYFDHPPMVAYMLYLFSLIFGKTVFAVKFADFIITLGTQLAFFTLSSKIIRSDRKYITWVLLSSTMLISSLSVVTTPDVPLLFFWTLSLLTLYIAIFEKKRWFWIWAGICMGLAFDSKYTALALPGGLFLFLIFSKRYRYHLATIFPYLAAILMILFTYPVIRWNIDNHFASFAFQSSERAETISGITIENFLGLVGTQFFLLLPIVFIGLWWVMFRYFGRIFKKPNQVNPEIWFLISFFVPMFIGFYMLSFFLWVKLNWLMPTYISGLILFGIFINEKWLKWHYAWSIALHVVMMVEIIWYVFPVKSDDTWYGWESLSEQALEVQKQYPESFIFSSDTYKTTAQLMFFTDQKIYGKNILGEHALHYSYIGDDLSLLKGKNAIFIDSHRRFPNDLKSGEKIPKLLNYFDSYTELEPILIKRDGKTVRKFCVYYCTDYKGTGS